MRSLYSLELTRNIASAGFTAEILNKILNEIICPITQEGIKEPITDIYGHTYEKEALIQWLKQKKRSPLTNRPLSIAQVYSNKALEGLLECLKTENQFAIGNSIQHINQTKVRQSLENFLYTEKGTLFERPAIAKDDGTLIDLAITPLRSAVPFLMHKNITDIFTTP